MLSLWLKELISPPIVSFRGRWALSIFQFPLNPLLIHHSHRLEGISYKGAWSLHQLLILFLFLSMQQPHKKSSLRVMQTPFSSVSPAIFRCFSGGMLLLPSDNSWLCEPCTRRSLHTEKWWQLVQIWEAGLLLHSIHVIKRKSMSVKNRLKNKQFMTGHVAQVGMLSQ